MYEQVGAIANRLPSMDVKQYLDMGDIPVLAYIPSDAAWRNLILREKMYFSCQGCGHRPGRTGSPDENRSAGRGTLKAFDNKKN